MFWTVTKGDRKGRKHPKYDQINSNHMEKKKIRWRWRGQWGKRGCTPEMCIQTFMYKTTSINTIISLFKKYFVIISHIRTEIGDHLKPCAWNILGTGKGAGMKDHSTQDTGHSLPWYPPIKFYKKSFGKGDIIGMISRSLTPIFKLCSVNLNMRASIFTCVHRLYSSTKLCMLKKYIQLLRRRKKDLHDSPSGQRWPLGPNPKWRLCLGIAHV